MVSETGDVQAFLAKHPPFNHLSRKQLEFASNNIFVAFSKSGSVLNTDRTDDDYAIGMIIVRLATGSTFDSLSLPVLRFKSIDSSRLPLFH